MDDDKPKRFLERFEHLLKVYSSKEPVFNYLRNTPDVLMLIELSLTPSNEKLREYCARPEMNARWDEIWKLLGKEPTFPESQNNSSLIYKELKVQHKITSYQLVCGMSLYNKTYHHPVEQHLSMLQEAARHHNFAALQSLSFIYGSMLETGKWISEEQCLGSLLKSAEVQGAPVYLLCAKMCIDYSKCYLMQSNVEKCTSALLLSLAYLYAAKFLEPFCENEIHNAYYGKSLFKEILKNTFSQIPINDNLILAHARNLGEDLAKKWAGSTATLSLQFH